MAVAVWSWVLLVPALAEGFGVRRRVVARRTASACRGSRPIDCSAWTDWSRLARAVTLSLIAGTLVTWLDASRRGVAPGSRDGAPD